MQVFQNNDVVLFTETWTNSFSEMNVDGFDNYILNRTLKHPNSKRDSGGLVIFISNKLKDRVSLVKKVSDCIIWLKFDASLFDLNDDVFMGLCYNTPEGSSREVYDDKSIFDMILEDMVNFDEVSVSGCKVFVRGDFNARTGIRNDFVENDSDFINDLLPDDYEVDQPLPRFSEDRVCNEYGLGLLDLCKSSGLRILNGRVGKDKHVGRFTCVKGNGRSVVDYVLCKPELFGIISDFVVDEPNIISDHCMIHFSIAVREGLKVSCNNKQCYSRQNVTYKWVESKRLEYIEKLGQPHIYDKLMYVTENLSNVDNDDKLNSNINKFYEIIEDVCDPLFKINIKPDNKNKAKSNQSQPWFDEECRDKRNEFYKNLNFYRFDQCEANRKNMSESRTDYKCTIRKAKCIYDKNRTIKLEKARRQNAREYWKLLKSLTGAPKVSTLSADLFAEYFKAINNPNDPFFQPDEDVVLFNERYINGELQVMFDELNVPLSEKEIRKATNQLKSGKSGGPDNVLNEFFRYGVDALMPYLSKLFNTVFDLGCFPDKWTDGFIVPLHKKGNKNEVENYRGITLLSTFGKLFSRILTNRLNEWAENYYVYIEAQAGFRKQMGTIDNIFVLHGLIRHFINEGKRLYAAFIDFTKAFDYVVRENLWLKLIKSGVRGKILNVIKSMYTSVKSMVKYNNCFSEEFSCFLGVRQGECLSPFLFSLYLNDIETEFIQNNCQGIEIDMLKVFLLLYADDMVIFSKDEEGLQRGLDVLYDYCLKWKLKVNINKTKVMVFRSGGTLRRNLSFVYNDHQIEIVRNFTYLGVVFTSGGSFTDTFEMLAGQARKAIVRLNKYLYKFTQITPKHYLDLFDKLIKPILQYGSEVWGFSNAPILERVQLQVCKNILGVKRSTQNDFVYGELGRVDLKTLRFVAVIKFWFKILTCENTKYITSVCKMMLHDIELHPNKSNWASFVKYLLESLGFNDVWYSQGVGNVNLFLTIFKQRLKDVFIQNWNSRILGSTRARTYSLFHNFSYKLYLDHLTLEKFRHALSKVRMSSHRLEIEAGRWHRPHSIPLDERKCRVCNIIEDKFHFILECTLFQNIRKKYIKRYFWLRPNIPKFIQLMTSENKQIIRNLASYVFESFKIRNSF